MSVNPVAPTAASVLLGLVGSGTARSYKVKACLANAPTNCKSLTCATVNCGPINGLASGARYVVSATATLTTGQTIKASSSLQLPMPPAAAPILIEAEPAGRRKGTACALPPRTGPCPSYFWVFSPAGGGRTLNATTDIPDVTTAGTALAPGGVYDAKVACLLTSRKAGSSRGLLQGELGPFSNTLRFVMPAAGAPFLKANAAGARNMEASIEPPTGTGTHWQDSCFRQALPGMPLPCLAARSWSGVAWPLRAAVHVMAAHRLRIAKGTPPAASWCLQAGCATNCQSVFLEAQQLPAARFHAPTPLAAARLAFLVGPPIP